MEIIVRILGTVPQILDLHENSVVSLLLSSKINELLLILWSSNNLVVEREALLSESELYPLLISIVSNYISSSAILLLVISSLFLIL